MYSAEWKCPLQRHRRCEGCEFLHSTQSTVAPFPTHCQCLGHCAKHWPGAFSVLHSVLQKLPGRWKGLLYCWIPWGMTESPPSLVGTQGKGCPGPTEDGEEAGRTRRGSFLALDLGRAGSTAVLLQVLSSSPLPPHCPFPRPPLPPCTAPNFSPLPGTCAIYLASVWSALSVLLVWFLSNYKLLWQRQTMTTCLAPLSFFPLFSANGQVWTAIGWLQVRFKGTKHYLNIPLSYQLMWKWVV